jgi:hypothetical protein
MTDVLSQGGNHVYGYARRDAAAIRPAVETFTAWAAATARAGGDTTLLPPIRISVAALQDLAAWLDS